MIVTDVLDKEAGRREDMIFWFVSFEGKDEWFAHGISNVPDSDRDLELIADEMAHTIPGGVMSVMIPFGGQRWSIISAHPSQHAGSQRDLLHVLDESQLNKLLTMSEDEIRALREAGEFDDPQSPNMN